jgi:N6-adenosine-specific RNA methylase IME4
VPLEKGGRGKKGGLSEYAEKIGKTKQHVSETREAAEVYLTVKASTQVDGFLDKCKHLAAIHKADRSCWPILADLLVAKGWNVQATEAAVDQAKQAEAILPKNWFRVHYVPLSEVVMAVAGGARQLKAFERLLAKVAEIQEYAEKHRGKSAVKAFLDWLAENKGGKSWDMGELQNYLLDLQEVEAPAGKYDVIVADPPWKYDFAETESRQVENQYPTMTPEELAALEVPSADNCVLFMWATAPKLREALTLLEAWGFQYKTHAVWNKEKIGMGYWFRGQHELLLVATKGDVSPPPPAARPASVFSDARKGHSRKPECAYATIEAMFPTANRCEMFARGSRSGWTSWGNEATKKQEKR